MTVINLANFIKARSSNGTQWSYHNASTNSFTVSGQSDNEFNGTYNYASFIYQGAAKNKTGDNFEAGLIMTTNPVSMDIITQGVRERWNVEVWTVVLNPARTEIRKVLTHETWIMASMSYDTSTIEVILSSAVDAVGAIVPWFVLEQRNVGYLPLTGQISAR